MLVRQGRCRALSDITPSPVDHSWSRSPPDEPDECHPDRETAGDHASVDGVSTGSGSTISWPWSSAELMMVRAVDSYSTTRFETSVMFDLYLLGTPFHRTAPMLYDQDSRAEAWSHDEWLSSTKFSRPVAKRSGWQKRRRCRLAKAAGRRDVGAVSLPGRCGAAQPAW